ncbi:MAG: bacillithiol biosynthesis cysteine-adding enzyme BshC [Flavobacteriales bacterium]|nr:bacillithiol biosynthesis cysteine-adding enzyme BshC [Flavobacteriales bacterium]
MRFYKQTIDLDETKLFNKLITDFANCHPRLNPLLSDFSNLNSVKAKIKNVKNDCRSILVSVLKEQYDNTSFEVETKKVYNNIIKISDKNTYTITTGHQLNVLLSPLFLIYKIITVISYSQYLNKRIKEANFVPCFWMASEDHDFEEINKIKLFDNHFKWDQNELNFATGSLPSKTILPLLEELKKILESTKFGKKLYKLYHKSISKNEKYTDSIRSILTSFFYDFGLVIIDGNHKNLKKMFVNEFCMEINRGTIYKTVKQTNELIIKNYKPHINPLVSNIFYLFKGLRSKIIFNGHKYFSKIHQQEWSYEELIKEIKEFPENFSPNVFLRPLYQQKIMPNILYVGGPSEISYWLQLKAAFHQMKILFPILQLRSFFLILSKRQSDFIRKYNLELNDLFLNTEEKIKKIILNLEGVELENFNIELDLFLKSINTKINKLTDLSLSSFISFEKNLIKEVKKLDKKILKQHKLSNKMILDQTRLIDKKLFPNNIPQERVDSFIPFYMKYGESFFELLISECSVFANKYTILNEKS